jgi:hypothetical protein
MVMQQAEVPERLAGDRDFGSAFVYESQLLSRRLGAVLVQQLDQLQALPGAAAAERGVGKLGEASVFYLACCRGGQWQTDARRLQSAGWLML